MNLTYEVNGKGYTILNNGVAWIAQDAYIPYPGATLEESAQNHINEILKDAEATTGGEIEQLKEDNIFIAETLALVLEEIEQLKAGNSAIKGE